MPAALRNPALAAIGLVVVALLCVQLLRDAITLETAALRALLTVVVLVLCDRIAIPIGRALLATSGPRREEETPTDDQRLVP